MPGASTGVVENYQSYQWLPGQETTQDVLLTAGAYSVIVIHSTGCQDTLEFDVAQVSNPLQSVITASGATHFCQGESVMITATEGYPSYTWNSGSVTDEITVFESGTYVVSIIDQIGCPSSSNSIQVTVDPLPVADFSPALDGYGIQFNNLSQFAVDHEWNFGDGSISTEFEPTHIYSVEGAVDMWLSASNGCGSDTAFLHLSSVGLQDKAESGGFSVYPNPSNGMFRVSIITTDAMAAQMSLYDPLGQRIFSEKAMLTADSNHFHFVYPHLSDGLHILELQHRNSNIYGKLIVQR